MVISRNDVHHAKEEGAVQNQQSVARAARPEIGASVYCPASRGRPPRPRKLVEHRVVEGRVVLIRGRGLPRAFPIRRPYPVSRPKPAPWRPGSAERA